MITETLSSNNSSCLSVATASITVPSAAAAEAGGDSSTEEHQNVSTNNERGIQSQSGGTRDPWLQVLESLDEEFGFNMLAEETAEKNLQRICGCADDNDNSNSRQFATAAAASPHVISTVDELEEIINAAEISDVLNEDMNELAVMAQVAEESRWASRKRDNGDNHDCRNNRNGGTQPNGRPDVVVLGPGAFRVFPYSEMAHQSAANARRDEEQLNRNQGDADDSNINESPDDCNTPYAQIIPEAVPIEVDLNNDCASACVNSAAVPPSAISVTSELKSRGTVLRRQALVDDVVCKLQEEIGHDEFDESQNIILIQGCGGTGKSVLCSMVVSNRSTLLHFADGIAWLSLHRVRMERTMTYAIYIEYLESICIQLGLELPTFNEPIILAADSHSIRNRKVQIAMEDAKASMCRLLSNRHILIVLDDVWNRSAVPWLNFSNRLGSHLRLLLSTRLRGGFGENAKTMDVGTLSLQEATTLLIRESGYQDAALTSDEEMLAAEIVTKCSLPVAICIAGRMLASSCNRQEAFQKLASEMSEAFAHQIDSQSSMFDLTDRCFAGPAGEALKVSFVAFSVVFTTNEGKRNFVPGAVAMKLIDALMLPEDRREIGCAKGTFVVLQQLSDMGLLERQGNTFKVRHDTGQEYSKQIMKNKTDLATLFKKRVGQVAGRSQASKSVKNAVNLISMLHLILTKEFPDISVENYWETAVDDGYLFLRLPWHMICASQSHLLARNILCSPLFLSRRIEVMGMLSCIKAQLHDIEVLDQMARTEKEKKIVESTIDDSFDMISDFIKERASPDNGRAYTMLAQHFQHRFRFSSAMEMFSRAHCAFQLVGGHEDEAGMVQKCADRIAFLPVGLVPKSSTSEDIIRFDGVANLLAQQEIAARGDMNPVTGIFSNSSGDAVIRLTLNSHPGMALCLSDKWQQFPGMMSTNLCIGPAESAISVKYESDRSIVLPDGKSFLCAGVSRGSEGDMLYAVRYLSRMGKMYGKTSTFDLIVNEDGSMSPRSRRDLVFAARAPQLFLVKRDSPCRLLLKYGSNLKMNQIPLEQDCSINPDKSFSAELVSHPGYSICHNVEVRPNAKLCADQVKVCTSSDPIQLVYDGKKLVSVVDGKCRYFLTRQLGIGDLTSTIYMFRDESGSVFRHEFEFGLHWIINDDGSISPFECPSHALGLHALSSTDVLLTGEQKTLAKCDAKKKIRRKRSLSSIRHTLRFVRYVFFSPTRV